MSIEEIALKWFLKKTVHSSSIPMDILPTIYSIIHPFIRGTKDYEQYSFFFSN